MEGTSVRPIEAQTLPVIDMGKITFTPLQKTLFDDISGDPALPHTFYFTGGTALSAFYLHHRESEDLDFFSEVDFNTETVREVINRVSSKIHLPYRFTQREQVRIFEFVQDEKLLIKIDFVYHPYKRLEKGLITKGEIMVDSLVDIATNKLLTVNQRTDAKDFVDLYFLLKTFTVWDLLYSIKAKYNMEYDIILLAVDFTKVEQFDFLPKMLVPFTLSDLKKFFRQKAIELGRSVVE